MTRVGFPAPVGCKRLPPLRIRPDGPNKSENGEIQTMIRILIVEDNEMNRDMLSRRLQKRGFETLLATDGMEALAMTQTEQPNLILMDMSLPVLDGWEATRRLKAAPETQAIPIIALTAHAIAGDRQRALDAGCDDYESKPLNFSELMTKIQRYTQT